VTIANAWHNYALRSITIEPGLGVQERHYIKAASAGVFGWVGVFKVQMAAMAVAASAVSANSAYSGEPTIGGQVGMAIGKDNEMRFPYGFRFAIG